MDASQMTDALAQLSDREFRDVMKSACYRRGRYLPDAQITAGTVIECLHELCNGASREVVEAWWEVWYKEHPTIRQTVVRTFVTLLKKWVKEWTDGDWKPDMRDADSYKLAQQLSEESAHLPYI